MQHEREFRGDPPVAAEGARAGGAVVGDALASSVEPRPPLSSDTVPSEQLWRAAIRAAREAAALTVDLRRQFAPPAAAAAATDLAR
ncbi:hypothetical protein [Roseisolibacter sp. H3M3-2]|uniref:hypothetical protein n=1 Tax=Roseisolibacter sp. H3M3-2 TaxID=3031323 RepID=UPI0023DBFF06|nr:hypothetical protein [Roseisolibacter sp. H3M3-2]MDF1501542.1 hypothetical protein [Roseisolibacter sp. H3M3-2]